MFAEFFINRPIFASVLSIILVVAGALAFMALPIAQYPDIAPPTIQITANWPGANATDVSRGVAIPIEKEVNGVENMLYMESKCTSDGQMNLTVTFEVGTDLNMAQVLVQNRVTIAQAKLPDAVKQLGVTTKKKSPSILMLVNFFSKASKENTRDQIYLSNYAKNQIKDSLARIKGVGDVTFLGEREYSIRINLDTQKLAMRGLTPVDVMNAVREQNQLVAAGQLGQPPVPLTTRLDFQNVISVKGRLEDAEEFENIILKTNRDKVSNSVRVIKLKEVATVELGAKSYDQECTVDRGPSVALAIYQLPGSNALDTAKAIRAELAKLKKSYPVGVESDIYYDTTPFIEESIHEVEKSFRDAVILVAIVVLVFLQSWRAAIIPLVAVPVSIVGTFAIMAAAGFSLNNLTLFGLVLAIGIVVDDAIVVVEAVEHHMMHGMTPKAATLQAMREVSGPVIAVAVVLCAVFVPTAFISGIQGQFYKQFALTIAVSTVISAFNSLTLSPALCAILLRPKTAKADPLTWLINVTLGWFFKAFNVGFDVATSGYVRLVKLLLRGSAVALLIYGGLLYLTGYTFTKVPTGFIPQQDKGYLMIDVQLPDAAALERTRAIAEKIDDIASKTHGVIHTIGLPGMSFVTGVNSPNVCTFFIILDKFEHRRHDKSLYADDIADELRKKLSPIRGARILLFGAPPVDGLGTTGGFKMQIQDKTGLGPGTLQGMGENFMRVGNAQPGLVGVYSSFRANTPQVKLVIDRENAKSKGVNLTDVWNTLQSTLGTYYVNDVTLFENNYQVNLQAQSQFRLRVEDIGQLRVKNNEGQMIPLSTFANVAEDSGPVMVVRYNTFPSAAITGSPALGTSSGQAIGIMDQLAEKELPPSMGFEWTDLSYQQVKSGSTATVVFALSVGLVFLVLSAQYESFVLPLAVILIVPMCLLCAALGVAVARMDINIFTQIGLVVLVGLASKNAILIVEFAKQKREEGAEAFDSAIQACQLRLRPIMMTSFAFILGVVPLVISTGAGAEMRRTLGTAVFSGMLGVTFFGIFLTPVFYYVLSWLTGGRRGHTAAPASPGDAGGEANQHH